MTFADVKRQILNLGFETKDTYQEDPTIIADALNLAMHDITINFPMVGKYKISQNPLKNLLPNPLEKMNVKHYDGVTPITYEASNAKSIYFECSGAGMLTITDDNGTQVIDLDSNKALKEYRLFADGNVTMSFEGDFSYDIKNVAIYGEKYSDLIEDIPPYRENIRYNFKELTAIDGAPVFIDFLDKVQEGNYSDNNTYKSIQDFQIEPKDTIVLNGFEKVEYVIFYTRSFVPFTEATEDTFEIELDFKCLHLLPLLACYYVWLDDDERKATMYYNKYEMSLNTLLGNKTDIVATIESAGDI